MDATSSHAVSFVLQVAIRDGQLENFEQVMHELVASTKLESGALNYEWFLNEERSICHICERYENDEAFLIHAASFGQRAESFLACVDPIGLSVYGNPGEAVRSALAGLAPTYYAALGGFSRR